MCTYGDCWDPNQLYDTRQDWIQHENAHRKVFRCPEHAEKVFAGPSAYQDHLKLEHAYSGVITEALLHHASDSTMHAPDRLCPACSFSAPTAKVLQSHVALHLERFSLFSLPRSVIGEDEDLGEAASNKVDAVAHDSLADESVEELFFDDDELPEVEESDSGDKTDSKWRCDRCAFWNPHVGPACIQCGTERKPTDLRESSQPSSSADSNIGYLDLNQSASVDGKSIDEIMDLSLGSYQITGRGEFGSEGNMTCPVCGKVLQDNRIWLGGAMRQHIHEYHFWGSKGLICTIDRCKAAFGRESSLFNHQKVIHGIDRRAAYSKLAEVEIERAVGEASLWEEFAKLPKVFDTQDKIEESIREIENIVKSHMEDMRSSVLGSRLNMSSQDFFHEEIRETMLRQVRQLLVPGGREDPDIVETSIEDTSRDDDSGDQLSGENFNRQNARQNEQQRAQQSRHTSDDDGDTSGEECKYISSV